MKNHKPIELMRALVKTHGSQHAAAKALGISETYLSQVLSGRRAVSDMLLDKLGLVRVEYFLEKGA